MPPQTQDTTVGFSPLINFRKKYPQYNDLDDDAVVSGLAKKYPKAYGDLPEQYTAYKSTFSTDKTIVPDKKDVVENTPPPEVNTQKTEPEVKLSTEPYTPLQTVDAFGTPKTQTETSPNRSNLFGIDPGVMNQSLEKVAPEFVERQRQRDELSNKLNQGLQKLREKVDPLTGIKLGDLKLENAPMDGFRNAVNSIANSGLKMIPGTIEALGLIADKVFQRGTIPQILPEDFITPAPIISGTTGEIGKELRKGIDTFAEVDPKVKGMLTSTLPSAVGSAFGFLAGGMIGKAIKIPTLLNTLVLSTSQAAEEYNSALEQTGDYKKAYDTFIGNLPFAATEVVPFERLFSRLGKLGGRRGTQLLVEMMTQGTVEGSQEVIQQFGANLNAKMIYDASRKLSEGTLEGGAAGFFTGMLLAGLGGVATKRLEEGNLTEAEIKDLSRTVEQVNLAKAKVEKTFKDTGMQFDKIVRDLQNPNKVKNKPKDYYKQTEKEPLTPPVKDFEQGTINITPGNLDLGSLTDLSPEERQRNGLPQTESFDTDFELINTIANKTANGNTELTDQEKIIQQVYPAQINDLTKQITQSPEFKQQQSAQRQQQKQIIKIDTDNFAELNRQVKNASRKRSLYNIDQLKQNIEQLQSPEIKQKAQALLDEAIKNNEKLQSRNVFNLENLAERKYGKTNLNELDEEQQQAVLNEYNDMKKQGIAEFKPINTVASVLKGVNYPEAIQPAPIAPRKTVADLEKEKQAEANKPKDFTKEGFTLEKSGDNRNRYVKETPEGLHRVTVRDNGEVIRDTNLSTYLVEKSIYAEDENGDLQSLEVNVEQNNLTGVIRAYTVDKETGQTVIDEKLNALLESGKTIEEALSDTFGEVAGYNQYNQVNKLKSNVSRVKAKTPKDYVAENKVSKESQVAGEDINLNPTDAQKEAGNYKKAHIKKDGLDISIENPKGSLREGKDESGKNWAMRMDNDYGYIKGTVGKDKDHLDVFLASDYQEDTPVFIVNQTTPDGKFDEHKVMLGFTNSEDAEEAYLKNYNEGAAHYNDVIEMPMDRFKKWSKDQSLTKRPAKAEEGFLEKFDKLPAEMQTKIRSEYEAEFEKAENKEALNKKYEEIVDKELQPKKEPATKWKNDLSKAPEGAFAVKLTTGQIIYDKVATNHTELVEKNNIEELDVVDVGFISEGKFLTTKEIADKAKKEVEAEKKLKTQKETPEKLQPQKTGYRGGDVGGWTSLKNIKETEVEERGNQWFDDSEYDLENTEAIFVTHDPKDALYYEFSANFKNLQDADLDNPTPDEQDIIDEIRENDPDEWDNYLKALEKPGDYVVKFDLEGAKPVMTDGEGGYLYVRPKGDNNKTAIVRMKKEGKSLLQIAKALNISDKEVIKQGGYKDLADYYKRDLASSRDKKSEKPTTKEVDEDSKKIPLNYFPSEYVKTSNDYYVKTKKEGDVKVEGSPVNLKYEGDYFIHKSLDDEKIWSISEGISGQRISYGLTKSIAIEEANRMLDNAGVAKVVGTFQNAIKSKGVTPRYKLREKNKGKEDLITKDVTTGKETKIDAELNDTIANIRKNAYDSKDFNDFFGALTESDKIGLVESKLVRKDGTNYNIDDLVFFYNRNKNPKSPEASMEEKQPKAPEPKANKISAIKTDKDLITFLDSQGKNVLLDSTDELADLIGKNFERNQLPPAEAMLFPKDKTNLIDKMLQMAIRKEARGKQPYEMSLEAFATKEFLGEASMEAGMMTDALYIQVRDYKKKHQAAVQKALDEGKEINPIVLKDYPEITEAKKPETKPEPPSVIDDDMKNIIKDIEKGLEGITFQLKPGKKTKAKPFYSKLQKTIEDKLPASFKPSQLSDILKSGEIKEAEIKWSGIEDWLKTQGGKINKKDVLDFLKANELQINEKQRGGQGGPGKKYIIQNPETGEELDGIIYDTEEEAQQALDEAVSGGVDDAEGLAEFVGTDGYLVEEMIDENQKGFNTVPIDVYKNIKKLKRDDEIEIFGFTVMKSDKKEWMVYKDSSYQETFDNVDDLVNYIEDAQDLEPFDGFPKYGKWTLPGGENYRELLFILPIEKKKDQLTKDQLRFQELGSKAIGTRTKAENEEYRKLGMMDLGSFTVEHPFTSPHWDGEQNIFAHTRVNDRFVDEKKYLHIEEVQSDWALEGRKKGFEGEKGELKKQFAISFNGEKPNLFFDTEAEAIEWKKQTSVHMPNEKIEIKEVERRVFQGVPTTPVPDMPFKNNWHEFVLKNLLRKAAEQGYDGITWVTGEQTAERYDLSKQVDAIEVTIQKDGTRHIEIVKEQRDGLSMDVDKDGIVIKHATWKGKRLDEVVGKDMADKIMKAEGQQQFMISNMQADGLFNSIEEAEKFLDDYKKSVSDKAELLSIDQAKIIEDKSGKKKKVFKGLDLKIGGEWAKNLYDKVIPNFLNKYAKKWNAKVGEINIGIADAVSISQTASGNYDIYQGSDLVGTVDKSELPKNPTDKQIFDVAKENFEITDRNEKTIVHSLPITPEMKKSVLTEGQPLFQLKPGQKIPSDVQTKANELIGKFVDKGLTKFDAIIKAVDQGLGRETLDRIFPALKAGYTAYLTNATDEETDKMDSFDYVKKYALTAGAEEVKKIQEIFNTPKGEKPGVVPKDAFANIKRPGTEEIEVSRPFIQRVREAIRAGNQLTKTQLEKIAKEFDITDANVAKEQAELAIVAEARKIINETPDESEAYNKLVEMYGNQPNLTHRTNESVEKQQYSTPAPVAYITGLYVNDGVRAGDVLEPSAGNGMLTIAFNTGQVYVNEIDKVRLANLRQSGFQDIKTEDSENNDNLFNRKFDGIMTNPPFGGTTPKNFDGYELAKLEHIMAANALKQMQSDGRAGIIIGGHNRYDNKGRLKNDRTFFNWLNHFYNVEGVLNVSGDLYRKQGAAFPIRVILVNGRKAVPQGASPLFNEVIDAEIKTFDELYNRIEEIRNGNILRPAIDGDRGQSGIADVRNPEGKTDQEAGGAKTILETEDSGTNTEKPTKPGQTSNVSVRPSGTGKSVSGKSDTVSGSDTGKSPLPNSPAIEESGKPGGIVEGGSGGNVQQGFDRGSSPVAPRAILDSDKANLSYVPESKGVSLDTVIPRNMAFDTAKTLKKIADSVGGDIDAFVAEKLGYQDKEELFSHLGAEQIDAVAMAIVAIEKGQGMIVGDMTGVGKGRIAASIIRYGNINGYEPIFFSEKADLYSDLYRDLNDIGSKDLNPFIVNEAASIVDEEGNVIHQSPKGKKKTDILQTGNLGGYDFVLCTYSQVNSERRGLKRNFIEGLSQGNILIMDESHNASGDSNTGSYFRKIVQASKGVTYLSATFAKRPDNMPIYALKTAISEANLSEEELVRAIERGGVALQEILSTDMVESGQMIRRERTYEGIKVTYKPLVEKKVEHTKIVDAVTGIVRDIIDFQTQHISGIVDRLDTVASETGETVTIEQGTNMAGVDNTPFASKVFNVVDQLLFSIKADSIADEAIEAFKRGQKPVIAVKNTMESFLDYLGAQPGEVIENTDFSTVLERGLRGVFRIRERDAMGNVTPSEITLNQLSEEGRKAYKALIDRINTTTTGITISPIDHIIYRLNKAGYKIGEVTGRDISLKFRDDGKAIVEKRTEKDKKKLFRDFNNWENPGESRGTEGFTDMALMINASGSTGRSAHSSPKFKDQRQRIMITGQIELNINTEIQKRGRVNRTGQVNKPEYITLASAIPAEQRLMMMAKKKLKSLDANVSSDQSQAGTTFEANDFLNKYGDEIVVGYLKENRDINDLLLDPLKMNGMSEDEYEKFDTKENAAHKVSGRVAILPTVLQAEFYKEMGHRYDDQIAYLESVGENDLEVKTLPLDAVTTSSRMLVAGKGGESPFGRDTMVETAEINVLKKPFRMEKINEMLDLYLEGSTKGDKKKTIQEEFKTFWKDWTETHLNKKKEVVAKALEISIEDVNKHLAGGISSEDIAKKYAQFAKFGPAASLKIDDEFNKYVRESDKLYAQSELVLNNILGRYNIGRVYKVPLIRDAVSPSYSNGIFLGWKINKNRKNPYAPSAIVLRFAVTDSRQVIEVVGSNKDWLNDLTSESASLEAWQEKDILSGWDNSLPDSRREVKQIVTGNILQAMGGDVKGQLVSYTTKDGGLKRGILIRDNKSINTDEVRVPIKRALKFIKNLDFGDFIETASGDVVLSNYNGSNWTIEVPASKQKGGKYYLDEAIRKVVKDGRFDKYGNQMRAVFSKSKLEELVNILQDDFGQSVRLSQDQLKQIEDGDTSYQLKGVKIYQDDFGNNIPANFSKIHEFKLKHPLLKNVEVEFVDPITVYWTREEIESYNYTPELLDLEKLEKGDFGYEEGKEKYPIEITGYNRGNPEQAGSSVTISSRATKSAYTEELIHTIYNGLEKTNPDLLRKINIWEEIVRDEASAYGIDIPQGGETFAQVMTFTHLGYADEAPNVAEAFEIPADILDEFTKMLDSGGVSSDVLKGNSQRGIIRLPSGKIDNSLTNFQNKRTKKGAISQIDPIIIKAQEVYKKLKSEKGETKDVYPEWVREMRTAYGPNFDKQARSIWKRKGEAFLPQYQLKIAQEGKSLVDSEFIERAKKHFGTTDNFKVAAWITTDGSMLDFSDKSSGGQSRVRTKEHEEIGTFEKDKTNYNKYSFNEMGNIRLISLSQNEGMEIAQPPTAAQKEVIRKIINSLDGKINIEIRPDSSFPYYEKFRKGTTAEEIFESISDYFSGRTRRPSFLSEFRQSYQLKKPKKTREQRFHGYKFDSETAREQGREPQNGEGNLVDFGIGLGNVITVTADKINDFVKNSQLEKRYNLENDSKAKKIYRELLTAPQWFFDKEPQLRRIWDIMDRYFVRNINEETAILKEDKWKNSKTWKKLSDLEQKEFLSALEEYEQTQYELQRDEGATELLDWMDFADEYNLTPKVADFLMRTYKPTIETALDMVKDVDRYKIINETETNPYLESYFGSVAKKLAPDQLQLELEKAKDEFFADDPNAQALFENELLRMTKPDEVKAMQLAWANNPNLRATLAEVLIDKKYESIDNKAYFPSSRLERKYFLSGLKKTTAEEKLLQGLFDDKFFTTSDSLSALEKIKIDLEAEGYTVKVGKFAEAQETILMNAVSQEDILDLALSAGVDQDNPTLEKLVKAIQAKGFSRHFIPKRFVPGFEYNKENFEEAIFKYITAVPFYKNRTIGGKEFAKTMSLLKHSGALKPGSANDNYIRDLKNKLENRDVRLSQGLRAIASTYYLALSPAYLSQQIVQPINTLLPYLPIAAKQLGLRSIEAEKAFGESLLTSLQYWGWKVIDKTNRVFGRNTRATFGLDRDFLSIIRSLERQGVGKPLRSMELAGQEVDPRKHYNRDVLEKTMDTLGWIAKIAGLPGIVIEDFTRTIGIRAFYNLGKKAGLTGDALEDFISVSIAKTYGPASGRLAKPPGYYIAGDGRMKIVKEGAQSTIESWLTFKNFAFMNFGQWGKIWRSLRDDNIYRTAGYKLGSQIGLGGLKYIMWSSSILTLMSLVYGMFDVPEDPDEQYKDMFMQLNKLVPGLGDALYKGVASVTFNVDLSSLFSQTAPIEEPFTKDAVELIGGAPVSAIKDIYSGRAPRVLRGSQVAEKWKEEGIKLGSRKLIPPDEITESDITKRKLGYTPLKVSDAYQEENSRQFKSGQYTDIIREKVIEKIIPLIESGKGDVARDEFRKIWNDMKEDNILTEHQKKSITGINNFISQVVLSRLKENERQIVKDWKNGYSNSRSRNENRENDREREDDR